jgi:hypothetical protein
VRELTSLINQEELRRVVDDDPRSVWSTNAEQDGTERLTADLGAVFDISRVSLEGATFGFPRSMTVELSKDGNTWTSAWQGPTAERSVAAAIDNPRVVPLTVDFPAQPAQYVRVTQTGHSRDPWIVGELRILGSGRQSTQ